MPNLVSPNRSEQPISGVYPTADPAVAIAEDCRAAALAFVNEVPRGWGKCELARWLVGPYANATRLVHSRDLPRSRDESIDPRDIETILHRARLNVMTVLEKMTLSRGGSHQLSFVDTMVSAQYVLPAVIGHRGGWIAIAEPRNRLRARVLALFAVDALVRPRDYAESLFVCHRCEQVVFDAEAVDRGYCTAHVA